MKTRLPKTGQEIYGYEWSVSPETNGHYRYAFLYLEVLTGKIGDISAEYDEYPFESELKLLEFVRKESGGLKYFKPSWASECFTLKWQTDQETWNSDSPHWYGQRFYNGQLRDNTVAIMAKLLKLGAGETPESIQKALEAAKALPIKYTRNEGCGAWLIQDTDGRAEQEATLWATTTENEEATLV